MGNKERIWKIAFFSLLGVVVVLLVIGAIILQKFFPDIEDSPLPSPTLQQGEAVFFINTSKDDLNRFIENRLADDEEDQVSYQVYLGEEYVEFSSTFSILGRNVPVEVLLSPEVGSEGELLLTVEEFSLGQFIVPSDQVLQIVKNFVELPEWVQLYPSESVVYISLKDIEVGHGAEISFVEFDLLKDHIELQVSFQEEE
ncbi:YpmS family protein [Bacillus alkalicellulosilyticus]|uniref:YpmS family protein n=1 Tax=Alkalihalobacterium alkalicellulosilyticum TaxID=1912214 RepID=UPI0009969E61|nr:YpmS family protein [Bacillus alkalicellulosilyticus]